MGRHCIVLHNISPLTNMMNFPLARTAGGAAPPRSGTTRARAGARAACRARRATTRRSSRGSFAATCACRRCAHHQRSTPSTEGFRPGARRARDRDGAEGDDPPAQLVQDELVVRRHPPLRHHISTHRCAVTHTLTHTNIVTHPLPSTAHRPSPSHAGFTLQFYRSHARQPQRRLVHRLLDLHDDPDRQPDAIALVMVLTTNWLEPLGMNNIAIALDPAIGLGLSMELAPCVAGGCAPIPGLVHTTAPPPMPATSPPNLTSPPHISPRRPNSHSPPLPASSSSRWRRTGRRRVTSPTR